MPAAGFHRLGDDAGDAPPRIERRLRILKHHLQAHGAARPISLRGVGQVIAIEQDPPAGWLFEADEELRDRALAAAALADQCDELVCGDAEGGLLHSLKSLRAAEQAAADRVVLLQLFDLQDDPGRRFRRDRRFFGCEMVGTPAA